MLPHNNYVPVVYAQRCYMDCMLQEIDTALVKLLAETRSSDFLIELIAAHDKRVSMDDCVEALEKNSVI